MTVPKKGVFGFAALVFNHYRKDDKFLRAGEFLFIKENISSQTLFQIVVLSPVTQGRVEKNL